MNVEFHPHRIELAEAQAFRIGDLEVRPATLEVISPGGRETLEPRVMQVFVAMAERRGEVLSRDLLNELCWGGRIVGDDALRRCISRLRRLGQEHGAFDIENVRRVGVRLVEPKTSAVAGGSRRWMLWAVAAAVVVLAAAWGVWRTLDRPVGGPTPSVVVGTFRASGNDPAGRELGQQLGDDIRGVLTDSVAGASVREGARAKQPDLRLDGQVARDGDNWRVRAMLTRHDGALIWTREYVRPVAEQGRLRDLITVGATESVFATLEALRQPLKLDSETLALFVTRAELATTNDPKRPGARSQLEETILARAPTFGLARGSYAMSMVNSIDQATPSEQARLKARVRQEIERAIRDSPRAGIAYDALYWLTRSYEKKGDLVAAEDVLLTGIARAPETHFILMRECRFLDEVGRAQAAVPYCVRALALRPMASPLAQPYASALYEAGRYEDAEEAIEYFARFHPDHDFVRSARFGFALDDGDFIKARRLLASPDTRPRSMSDEAAQALELVMQARTSGNPDDADRAIAAMRTAMRTGGLSAGAFMASAVRLGRLDDAFAAFDPKSPNIHNDIPVVFKPAMAPMRKDPRFWMVVGKAGYVRYWRTRNTWPDFCNGPNAELDCPAAATRAGY